MAKARPSQSKPEASLITDIWPGDILPTRINQRLTRSAIKMNDFADQDRVVTDLKPLRHPAVETGQPTFKQRRARAKSSAFAFRKRMPAWRRKAVRKMLLFARKDAHRVMVNSQKGVSNAGHIRQTPRHKGRLE